MNFNILITHEPGIDNYRFILSRLRSHGIDYVLVDKGPSVILLRAGDPYEFVEKVKDIVNNIQVLYRVIPVDMVMDPYVEVVAENATRLAEERIPFDKSFRVTLHGRLYWLETRLPAHTYDAVKIIAEGIKRPVSLVNPDYIVYVRSVKLYYRRRYATLTVTTPNNIIVTKSNKP
ncbi:MAG: hypothetical protein QXP02_01545 [Desulfurococcaceae archaeon]